MEYVGNMRSIGGVGEIEYSKYNDDYRLSGKPTSGIKETPESLVRHRVFFEEIVVKYKPGGGWRGYFQSGYIDRETRVFGTISVEKKYMCVTFTGESRRERSEAYVLFRGEMWDALIHDLSIRYSSIIKKEDIVAFYEKLNTTADKNQTQCLYCEC